MLHSCGQVVDCVLDSSSWQSILLTLRGKQERKTPISLEDGVGCLQDSRDNSWIIFLHVVQQLWQQIGPLCGKVVRANDCQCFAKLCSHRHRCAEHQADQVRLYLLLQERSANSNIVDPRLADSLYSGLLCVRGLGL